MERKTIHEFYHEHELILTEKVSSKEPLDCYGCGDSITDSESAYVCTQQPHCSSSLHKKCAELPRQLFSHPSHPEHLLHLFDCRNLSRIRCGVCRVLLGNELGYQCRICDFDIHIKCGEREGMDELIKEKRVLQHPSHLHPLTLMRKPAFSFTCDGCGIQDVDMAYICITCEYWLHKGCASLPLILPYDRHGHHHQLSLAFCFPKEHRSLRYACGVCGGNFDMGYWLYFCGDCIYFVHIQCIDVTQFPLHVDDICDKLIIPFITRESTTLTYLTNYHRHPGPALSMIKEEEEEEEEEEDGELKICDVCVTPICSPPYYKCLSCKCFVHPILYMLPKTLSTSSFDSPHLCGYCSDTHNKRHKFTLYTSSSSTCINDTLYTCALCNNPTNGMIYKCEGCEMKIDVKCASLPTTIRHASHSDHKGLTMTRIPSESSQELARGNRKECHGCQDDIFDIAYCCKSEGCDFALDFKCVLLPPSIVKDEWDHKHPLMLTFDLGNVSDLICEVCEEAMHPKQWVYHCHECDYYIHLHCFKTISGSYRNIKFGHRFVLDDIHHHPLTFNCVTLKKRCDIFHDAVHNYYGLECASCYFVVCLHCGGKKNFKH